MAYEITNNAIGTVGETICSQFFAAKGYRVERFSDTPDGNAAVDFLITDNNNTPTLVECKVINSFSLYDTDTLTFDVDKMNIWTKIATKNHAPLILFCVDTNTEAIYYNTLDKLFQKTDDNNTYPFTFKFKNGENKWCIPTSLFQVVMPIPHAAANAIRLLRSLRKNKINNPNIIKSITSNPKLNNLFETPPVNVTVQSFHIPQAYINFERHTRKFYYLNCKVMTYINPHKPEEFVKYSSIKHIFDLTDRPPMSTLESAEPCPVVHLRKSPESRKGRFAIRADRLIDYLRSIRYIDNDLLDNFADWWNVGRFENPDDYEEYIDPSVDMFDSETAVTESEPEPKQESSADVKEAEPKQESPADAKHFDVAADLKYITTELLERIDLITANLLNLSEIIEGIRDRHE